MTTGKSEVHYFWDGGGGGFSGSWMAQSCLEQRKGCALAVSIMNILLHKAQQKTEFTLTH